MNSLVIWLILIPVIGLVWTAFLAFTLMLWTEWRDR